MLIGRRCFVSGRVQGVFYRASTRQRALELGCSGYAHNLPDGRVEVLVRGDEPAVQALVAWLSQGPPAAQVSHVDVQALSDQEIGEVPAGFRTR